MVALQHNPYPIVPSFHRPKKYLMILADLHHFRPRVVFIVLPQQIHDRAVVVLDDKHSALFLLVLLGELLVRHDAEIVHVDDDVRLVDHLLAHVLQPFRLVSNLFDDEQLSVVADKLLAQLLQRIRLRQQPTCQQVLVAQRSQRRNSLVVVHLAVPLECFTRQLLQRQWVKLFSDSFLHLLNFHHFHRFQPLDHGNSLSLDHRYWWWCRHQFSFLYDHRYPIGYRGRFLEDVVIVLVGLISFR
uniref:(northern house mosquito) hypothetical protein n=1 Tax=Culex pipiens TaxID=7175 RepID=A0A8D8IBF8_CULPI